MTRWGLIRLVGGFALLTTTPTDARAHRLDEYLQATRVSLGLDRVELACELTPGVAIAAEALAWIDANRNGRIARREQIAYAQSVLRDMAMWMDQERLVPRLTWFHFPSAGEIRDGVGVIRIRAEAAVRLDGRGRHTLSLTNLHRPAHSAYLVNAMVPRNQTIQITQQSRDARQQNYRLEFSVRADPRVRADP